MPKKTKTVKSPRLQGCPREWPARKASGIDVMLSPQLKKDKRWSRAVQKALVGSMQKWFVTVDRRRLERALRGVLAIARLHYTDVAFRRSSRVRRANRMLAELGLKEVR